MDCKLSILIPSTIDREAITYKLVTYIRSQIDLWGYSDRVEILLDIDNKEVSIGAKRQRMLEKAKGEYVVQIDSDDWVPDNYVETILKALGSNPDSIGHEILCSGTAGKTESASNQYAAWNEKVNGFDYVRTPYPKTPILRSICLKIGFKDLRYGEDHDFSVRLKESGLIKTEVYIPEVLYFYRYKFQNHRLKYGIKN